MIVTVASFKGGVGKTTTAYHIADYLQKTGQPTLLIDYDPNRSASNWRQRDTDKQAGFIVAGEKAAARYTKDAHYIVIDTPARPNREEFQELVTGCDLLLLPTTTDILSIETLLTTLDSMRDLERSKWRILLTRTRGKRATEDTRTVLTERGLTVLDTTIPNLVAFEQAALFGIPVRALGDAAALRASDAYAAVGRHIQLVEEGLKRAS